MLRVVSSAAVLGLCLAVAGPSSAFRGERSSHAVMVLAQQGNADAQNELGVRYSEGHGVPRDDVLAVEWFLKAAEQGWVEAQYNLSVMYANGQGVPQNDTETAKWTRLAAKQGHPEAQYQLGLLYAVGAGIEQDYVQAFKWFSLAAQQLLGDDAEIAIDDRNLVAAGMTPEKIREADRLVKEFKPMVPGPQLAAHDG